MSRLEIRVGILVVAFAWQALAQSPAFCPPANAKVDPPIAVEDDLCKAPPSNPFRLQEQGPPLTFKQKTAYFAKNKIFSGSAFFGAAFMGGIAQWRHDPPQWSQGAQGFGYRFGTRYAQSLTKSTAEWLFGFMEDPRQDPPPQPMILRNGVWVRNPNMHDHHPTGFGKRLGYALLSVVWTHNDSGNDGIAYSRIAGGVSSGLVGRLWTPDPTNTWGQVGIRTASAFGGYAAGAVFHEFQPDLSHLLARITGQSKVPPVSGAPAPSGTQTPPKGQTP